MRRTGTNTKRSRHGHSGIERNWQQYTTVRSGLEKKRR
nr:MAG TPA: hypothetical protein [Caudoviricetes sp.]